MPNLADGDRIHGNDYRGRGVVFQDQRFDKQRVINRSGLHVRDVDLGNPGHQLSGAGRIWPQSPDEDGHGYE
jgi:hypothetical protein